MMQQYEWLDFKVSHNLYGLWASHWLETNLLHWIAWKIKYWKEEPVHHLKVHGGGGKLQM